MEIVIDYDPFIQDGMGVVLGPNYTHFFCDCSCLQVRCLHTGIWTEEIKKGRVHYVCPPRSSLDVRIHPRCSYLHQS